MMIDINKIECGDVLTHVLGFKVSVIQVIESHTGKEKTQLVKCKFLDVDNMMHVFDFFPKELREG
jgi:hypothetical protein